MLTLILCGFTRRDIYVCAGTRWVGLYEIKGCNLTYLIGMLLYTGTSQIQYIFISLFKVMTVRCPWVYVIWLRDELKIDNSITWRRWCCWGWCWDDVEGWSNGLICWGCCGISLNINNDLMKIYNPGSPQVQTSPTVSLMIKYNVSSVLPASHAQPFSILIPNFMIPSI